MNYRIDLCVDGCLYFLYFFWTIVVCELLSPYRGSHNLANYYSVLGRRYGYCSRVTGVEKLVGRRKPILGLILF